MNKPMSDVDERDDDWYDDDDWRPAREEPNCGGCGDNGHVRSGRLRRLLRRPRRRCPDCNPGRLDILLWPVQWRYQQLRHALRRYPRYNDEPPF